LTPNYEFLGSDDFVIKRTQEITDDFLTQNAEKRSASRARMGEFHQFASIPTGVVDKWLREGFNIWHGRRKSDCRTTQAGRLERLPDL
jgi:hypothetical protein